MDYSHPQRADLLASEYVLGTMRGGARRRFETLLPAHPALQRAVWAWQDAIAPLGASVPAVTPSPAVWSGIEARLFGVSRSAVGAGADAGAGSGARRPWWQRLAAWRAATGVASFAAVALSVALMMPTSPATPVLIVLSPNDAAPVTASLLSRARFVASISADGRALILRPIDALPLDTAHALELWALPPQGAPRSLGLVSAHQATRLQRTRLLQDTHAFAVSIEPAGGSPTGSPTGPVISVGKLSL